MVAYLTHLRLSYYIPNGTIHISPQGLGCLAENF